MRVAQCSKMMRQRSALAMRSFSLKCSAQNPLGATHRRVGGKPLRAAATDEVSLQASNATVTSTSIRKDPYASWVDTAVPVQPVLPSPAVPAVLDAQRFRLDPSVAYWQRFGEDSKAIVTDSATLTTPAGIRRFLNVLVERIGGRAAMSDQQSTAYWAYHTARMTFFITQAVAGLIAHYAVDRLSGMSSNSSTTASAPAPAGATPSEKPGKTPLERIAAGGQAELVARVTEGVGTWTQDLAAIRQGKYNLPWDMTTPMHRQFNPLFIARRSWDFLQEASGTLARRMSGASSSVWLSSKSKMYPSYFTNSYHYQKDGWMSAESAEIYEHSTEVLFFGRQDAMQRCALLPLSDYVVGKDTSSMKLLELSAGTGRFHTFIKDNYPDMQTVCSDLSPFYLAKARENVLYWKSQRHPNRNLGGLDGTGVEFVQTAAEDIAAPDASFDVVVSVYLFHELPADVRKKVVAEMFRVLKPGGLAVLTDSVQLGDRPDWDKNIVMFENFQEPFYRTYISTDFGALFEDAGFTCETKHMNSATKTLAFTKPLTSNTTATSPHSGISSAAPAVQWTGLPEYGGEPITSIYQNRAE